jgi:hypothetical protein
VDDRRFGKGVHMPLEKTHLDFDQNDPPDVIGFWMKINDADPVSPVRIFVTAGALEQLDSSQPPDSYAYNDIFAEHRELIEGVASDKFDKGHVERVTHEGRPVVRISSDDLP